MKVLFIGGNGNISWWCVEEAIKHGHEVWELNRGCTTMTRRTIQSGVKCIKADVRSKEICNTLSAYSFDVICDFICYNEQQAKWMINLFKNRCKQYIVISSECVYKDRSGKKALQENDEKYAPNEADGYVNGKIKLEQLFWQEYKENHFPITIVRPCLTYDTIMFTPIGKNDYSVIDMIKRGYPMIVPGEGENWYLPLHSKDFARAFVSLIGDEKAIGQDYLITGDEKLTLNQLASIIFHKMNIKPNIKHISCDILVKSSLVSEKTLFFQQTNNYCYSSEKIKTLNPSWGQCISFSDGIEETIKWLNEDKKRIRLDNDYMKKYISLIKNS